MIQLNFNMAAFVFSFCVCLLTFIASTQSSKIVFLPMFGGSNYIGIKRMAQELATRGHEVTVLVNSAQNIKHSADIKHVIYQVPYEKGFLEKALISVLIKNGLKEMLFNNNSMPVIQQVMCEGLLKDTKMLDSFKHFDLIVADISNFCTPIVSDYLGIRRVDYMPAPAVLLFTPSNYDSFLALSYVPQMMSLNPSKMNFLQRAKNVAVCLATKIACRLFLFRGFQDLKTKYNVRPEKSYLDSMQDNELTLFMGDFAYDQAQPIRPDHKLVGPLNIQPVKPLPPDLQQLIDSSGDDGVIIVSFGSNVASVLAKEKVDIMAEAFGRLKQKVIWRLKGYIPSPLSPNIKVVDWLPQNDLLAHEKLRVFVSHCGMNSVFETLFRGVPVVSVPVYGDQFENGFRLKEKGVALVADYSTLKADDLYNKIQRVINEPSFKENAKRISRLLNDRRRTPVQEAGDWIEYALRHESLAHLRPYSSQLAWYQYFLVDVALFLVLVVLVVIMVIKYTFRLMCWMCCRRNTKQKTQ